MIALALPDADCSMNAPVMVDIEDETDPLEVMATPTLPPPPPPPPLLLSSLCCDVSLKMPSVLILIPRH